MTAIKIDESRMPIMLLRHPKEHTYEEWQAHTQEMGEFLERTKRFAMISDTTGAQPPDAAERKLIAESFEKHEKLWRERCVGAVVIVHSQLVRGAITALQWLRPPPFEHTVVLTMKDAEAWANERLKAP